MIDAHFHLWEIGRNGCTWPTEAEAAIHRDFGCDDYHPLAARHGIARAVLVQSQEDVRDTDWLLNLAVTEPIVGAVVGWTDLAAPEAPEAVARLAARPGLAGLRPMAQDRYADWYDDPALAPGLAAMAGHGLRFDALVRMPHLAALDRLAARLPDLAIVVDHAAKPRIGDERGYREWRDAIAPLADRPNVMSKLSGLLTESGGAPAEAIGRYVEALLGLFGPDRLMWGSDWPVLEMAAPFDDWVAFAKALVPTAHHEAVFGGTTARFYGVERA